MKVTKFFATLLLCGVVVVSCNTEEISSAEEVNAKLDVLARTTGNGAPNGAHYTLNIIGVSKEKTADMTGDNGRRIFVKLEGKTKILLGEGDFQVLDANGTDKDGASFQLPTDVTNTYAVYARPLGKPGGSAILTTCAEDPATGDEFCSTENYLAIRDKGRSTFTNVSKYLLQLTILVDPDDNEDLSLCLGGEADDPEVDQPAEEFTVDLFDDCLENYFWDYDNNGLRLLQLRFYELI